MANHPMKPGTTVGDIKTPMAAPNVNKQGTPGVYKYPGQRDPGSGGSSIKGPGEKNAWKK